MNIWGGGGYLFCYPNSVSLFLNLYLFTWRFLMWWSKCNKDQHLPWNISPVRACAAICPSHFPVLVTYPYHWKFGWLDHHEQPMAKTKEYLCGLLIVYCSLTSHPLQVNLFARTQLAKTALCSLNLARWVNWRGGAGSSTVRCRGSFCRSTIALRVPIFTMQIFSRYMSTSKTS